jgi:MFS family permease
MSLSQAEDRHRGHGDDHGLRGLWSHGRRGLTVGLVLTITLVAFEALAVSTIMPIVARELQGIELYGWVFTAFMLGSLIGIVVVGGLIDRRGLGGPFAVGIGLFAIGLIIGGLAPSMPVLVAARFLQGLGAGTVPPIAYVAIGRSLPEHLRPVMFATLSTAWVLPGVMGPALAGIVAETAGWRWVFLGLLPLIVLSASIAFPAVRSIGPDPDDAANAATLRERAPLGIVVALGAGLLLAGLTSGQPVLLVVLGVVGTLLAVFALRRLTPAGTLRAARGLPTAVLMRGIITFAFFAVDAYVALALVEWRGMRTVEAGIALTAATICWTAGSWTQAHFSSRHEPAWFVRVGLLVLVVGLGSFMVVLLPTVSPWIAVPTLAVAGYAMGLAYSPLALIVLKESPAAEQGRTSAAISLTDSLGTALGTGITGALVAASVRGTGDPAAGLAIGFGVAVAVTLLGVALGGRLHGAPARDRVASVAVAPGS